MASSKNNLMVMLEAPKRVMPSLLHIGVQSISLLRLQNQGRTSFGPAGLQLVIPELSVQPIRLVTAKIPAAKAQEFKYVRFPLELLNRMSLANLQPRDEGLPCKLDVLLDDGHYLATADLHVMPPNAWDQGRHPEALAGFVQKESPAVVDVLQTSRPFLREHLNVGSFADALELPLKDHPDRTENIIQAFYRALFETFHIHYEREVRSYPGGWQKIRFHDRLLRDKQGTCIDLALFLMACLESVHLDPLLVLVQTGPDLRHAIVGCWRDTNVDGSAVIRRRSRILDRLPGPVGSNELILLDPTGFSVERGWPFSKACLEGIECFTKATKFVWALNIARTRVASSKREAISPMPFGDSPTLSPDGWKAIRHSEVTAREFRYDIVERAHLFHGILHSARQLIQDLFHDRAKELVARAAERLKKKSPGKDARIVWQTPNFQKILNRAATLAEEHGSGLIGPVQLLHALLQSPGDTVERVLWEVGIDSFAAAQTLIRLAQQDPQRASYLESRGSRLSSSGLS